MTTVALFGGSFNPPHIAHQMVALWVLETQAVDGLWMLPTWRHPFGKPLVDFEHRFTMCELALRPLGPRARVDRIEAELARPQSRTYETLEALTQRHPGVGFRWVVGSDILGEVDKWYRWADVQRLAPPIVVARRGHPGGHGPELAEVSSTEVRARLGRGDSAIPLVPIPVMDYIAREGLYR
jgi:nicotinate-nucleotide adenylyltransferase